jgi:hypothetical protein
VNLLLDQIKGTLPDDSIQLLSVYLPMDAKLPQ